MQVQALCFMTTGQQNFYCSHLFPIWSNGVVPLDILAFFQGSSVFSKHRPRQQCFVKAFTPQISFTPRSFYLQDFNLLLPFTMLLLMVAICCKTEPVLRHPGHEFSAPCSSALASLLRICASEMLGNPFLLFLVEFQAITAVIVLFQLHVKWYGLISTCLLILFIDGIHFINVCTALLEL